MRPSIILAVATPAFTVGAVSTANIAEVEDPNPTSSINDLSSANHYGAPIPPWNGGKPGWYFGSHPENHPDVVCLCGVLCEQLDQLPFLLHCPIKPPSPYPTLDGYHQTFSHISAAVRTDDYITSGLVDTVPECKALCDTVDGCGFVNTYHDVHGKNNNLPLTCVLFKDCHGVEDADYVGGQIQPDGTINFIAESDGWCKD